MGWSIIKKTIGLVVAAALIAVLGFGEKRYSGVSGTVTNLEKEPISFNVKKEMDSKYVKRSADYFYSSGGKVFDYIRDGDHIKVKGGSAPLWMHLVKMVKQDLPLPVDAEDVVYHYPRSSSRPSLDESIQKARLGPYHSSPPKSSTSFGK